MIFAIIPIPMCAHWQKTVLCWVTHDLLPIINFLCSAGIFQSFCSYFWCQLLELPSRAVEEQRCGPGPSCSVYLGVCVQCPQNCRCGVTPAQCDNNLCSLWTGQVSRSQLILTRWICQSLDGKNHKYKRFVGWSSLGSAQICLLEEMTAGEKGEASRESGFKPALGAAEQLLWIQCVKLWYSQRTRGKPCIDHISCILLSVNSAVGKLVVVWRLL